MIKFRKKFHHSFIFIRLTKTTLAKMKKRTIGSRLQKQFPVPWKIHPNSCMHCYLTRRNPKIIKKNPPLSTGGFMYNLSCVCGHITWVNREYLFWRTLREIGHARRATFHYFHGGKHAPEIYVGKAEKCEGDIGAPV